MVIGKVFFFVCAFIIKGKKCDKILKNLFYFFSTAFTFISIPLLTYVYLLRYGLQVDFFAYQECVAKFGIRHLFCISKAQECWGGGGVQKFGIAQL